MAGVTADMLRRWYEAIDEALPAIVVHHEGCNGEDPRCDCLTIDGQADLEAAANEMREAYIDALREAAR